MNEHIKKLAEQAGYPDYMTYGQDKVLERFAELIVKECMSYMEDGDIDFAKFMIKKHFELEGQVTESNEWHTCPYAEEIHHDYDTLCDCDEERTYQCARDI